jgi:hypothetical protein
VQLTNGFLYTFVSELFGGQPPHTALADLANGEDIFTQ